MSLEWKNEEEGGFSSRKVSNSEIYTVEEAINRIGNGKGQRIIFTAMIFCLASSIMESMGISYMIPAAICDLELDTFRIGILNSAFFLGIIFTQHLWGFLADVYGRKFVVQLSLFLAIVFHLPTAFIPNFWVIAVLRFLSGMSLAGSSAMVYVYLGEFYTDEGRGPAIIFLNSFAGLTEILMPSIAWLLYLQDFSIKITDSFQMSPWRFQILIQFIPGILCVTLVHFLPETPRFLASVRKEEKAIESLQWLQKRNANKANPDFQITQLKLPEIEEEDLKHSKSSLSGFCYFIFQETKMLLKPPHVFLLFKCCYIQFSLFLIGVGIGMWFPELTNRISDSHGSEMTICQIIRSKLQERNTPVTNYTLTEVVLDCNVVINNQTYIANMILGLIHFFGFNLLGIITKKIHKNYATGACLLLSGVSGILMNWFTNVNAILGMFLGLLVFSGLSISTVAAIVVDLFPTHLRGMAVSLVGLFGISATFSGASASGLLLESNCEITLFGLSALIIIASFMAWNLPRHSS